MNPETNSIHELLIDIKIKWTNEPLQLYYWHYCGHNTCKMQYFHVKSRCDIEILTKVTTRFFYPWSLYISFFFVESH